MSGRPSSLRGAHSAPTPMPRPARWTCGAYLPGIAPHHVVALRRQAACRAGPILRDRRSASGTLAASRASSTLAATRSACFAAADETTRGDRLAVGNVEYRFPLAIVERGHGTWPLLFRTVHAAVFGDVGQVRGEQHASAVWARAFGGELSADAVAGYSLPFAMTVGVSWSDNGRATRGTTVYARFGRAF